MEVMMCKKKYRKGKKGRSTGKKLLDIWVNLNNYFPYNISWVLTKTQGGEQLKTKHLKVQLILTLTVLQCCLFYLVSHRISLNPRHDWPNLHGFKNSKSYFLSHLKCCLTSCACGQAWNPDSVQGGQKQGQRPALLLLLLTALPYRHFRPHLARLPLF